MLIIHQFGLKLFLLNFKDQRLKIILTSQLYGYVYIINHTKILFKIHLNQGFFIMYCIFILRSRNILFINV